MIYLSIKAIVIICTVFVWVKSVHDNENFACLSIKVLNICRPQPSLRKKNQKKKPTACYIVYHYSIHVLRFVKKTNSSRK